MCRIHSRTLLAVLALAICTGTLQAAAVLAGPVTPLTLTCDTLLGPGPAVPVAINLLSGSSILTVTPTAATAGVVVFTTVNGTTNGTTPATAANFTVSLKPGCQNATVGGAVTLIFTPSGVGSAFNVTANMTITNASSTALALSPSAVTVTCTRSGSVDTAGAAQTVNVTSPANGGTPFTVDPSFTSTSLTVTGGGTASATPVAVTVTPKAGCGSLPPGATVSTVNLLNPPAAPKALTITLQVGVAAAVSPSPSSITVTYTKNSAVYTGTATTTISAIGAPVFFNVDTTSLPIWLNVDTMNGLTPQTLTFSPTGGAETLAPGSYTANVHFKVSGALDATLAVALQVSKAPSTLSTAEGNAPPSINWTIGTALPTLLITPISSDSPVPYTVTTPVSSLSPQVSSSQGLAYSFGSPFYVTFLQSVFSAALPNVPLTGTVVLHYGSGLTYTVTITVNVKAPVAPSAIIKSSSPAALPTAASGSTFLVVLSGTGFVASGANQVTNVGVVVSGNIVADSNISVSVSNSSSIVLTVTVPANADPYLPFSGLGGSVTLGVCNPNGTSCTAPVTGGTITLQIGVNPIVQAVTSASSYIQATPPALTAVAPYDILSIFGTNFCVSGGTGCTTGGATPTLYGTTDPATLRYLTSLSPDSTGAGQRSLSVSFWTHAAAPNKIADAPLLFATNSQINLLVPDAVVSQAGYGKTVDIVVNFGYGSTPAAATWLRSSPYSVTVASANPGVFVMNGDGQGDAAALNASNSSALVTTAAPAGLSTAPATSDSIALYMTGLGEPSAADAPAAWQSLNCMGVTSYLAALNLSTPGSTPLTMADGLVLQSALFTTPTTLSPCLPPATGPVAVTVGGQTATVTYVGWVADSVAGLYQVNVQLPNTALSSFTNAAGAVTLVNLAAAQKLPIVVKFGTGATAVYSQSGVTLSVKGRLKVTPSGTWSGNATLSTPWAGSSVLASGGTGPYTYAGTLPAGLALDPNTGVIAGTPTDSSGSPYTVVITATDTKGWTGTVSVVFTII